MILRFLLSVSNNAIFLSEATTLLLCLYARKGSKLSLSCQRCLQVALENNINIGKISSLPASMSIINTALEKVL